MYRPLLIAAFCCIGSVGCALAQEAATPPDTGAEPPVTDPEPPVCKIVQGPVMTRRCPSGKAWFERCGKGANRTLRDTNTCVE